MEANNDIELILYFLSIFRFGLVGQLRPNNENKFDKPLVVAYYEVDWKRNKKGKSIRKD